MAEFIKALGLRAECIWHSGKTRAMQTAQLLSGAVKPDRGCLQHSGLGPNDDVEIIRDELKQIDQDIMIVGHLPFLSRLASLLLVAEPSAEVIAFRQAGIVCLERLVQQWQLQWLVIPQILS
jgi:phosphohistidine phosphatase